MSDVVLSVENVSKRFRIGSREPYHRFSEVLTGLGRAAVTLPQRWLRSQLPPKTATTDPQEFWALKDVSFEVKQGEVVGIIGRNGAGKSTLLKVLSRITEPTSGRIGVRGRIGSLLEVGTGFHPELTGRENIFLNGAILGMSRSEVLRRFDEIVAFAEIEQFLDTPVKRYSSGMYVRLGFAVAAHLDTEVLIVDEVLAVGDVSFQKKCLGKMGEVAQGGRTVLFVSHDLSAVERICSSVLMLVAGKKHLIGNPPEICRTYCRGTSAGSLEESLRSQLAALPKDRTIGISAIQLIQRHVLKEHARIDITKPLELAIAIHIDQPERNFRIYVDVVSDRGDLLFRSFDCDWLPAPRDWSPGDYQCRVTFPAGIFAPRAYVLHLHAGQFEGRYALGSGITIPIECSDPAALMPAFPNEPIRGRLAPLSRWTVNAVSPTFAQ